MWADVTRETSRIATGHWTPFLASEASTEVVLGLPPAPRGKQPPTEALAMPESRFPGSPVAL